MDTEYGLSPIVLKEICEIAEKCHVNQVVLFGSRARGDYRKRSDIDLAVSGGEPDRFFLLVDEETSTLLKFDVVNMDGAVQEELRNMIQKEGKIIYEKV